MMKTEGVNEISGRRSEYEEKLLEEILEKLSGTLTYSDEDITKHVYNRDANGYVESIDYYAGSTKKFTLTVNMNANKKITSIERT